MVPAAGSASLPEPPKLLLVRRHPSTPPLPHGALDEATANVTVTGAKSMDHCGGVFGGGVGDCVADFTMPNADDPTCPDWTLWDHRCKVIMMMTGSVIS